MEQYLRDLFEIQKIDLEIRELEKHSQSAPVRLDGMKKSIDRLHKEIEELSAQRKTLDKDARDLDRQVHAESHKIRKWETRLNEIRNQREYLALSREIEGSKRANREAEDKILASMSDKERVDARLESLQDKLAEEDVDYVAEQDTVASEIQALTDKTGQQRERRKALVPRVPVQLFKKYEMIRSKRLGVGVVSVTEGSCTGCNMQLPPQLYNVLQRGDSVEQCPSCNRLIFWDKFLFPADNEDPQGLQRDTPQPV